MNFIIRPYKQGEEKYVADLHKALYSTEYSWGPSFTDYAMKICNILFFTLFIWSDYKIHLAILL